MSEKPMPFSFDFARDAVLGDVRATLARHGLNSSAVLEGMSSTILDTIRSEGAQAMKTWGTPA